MEALAVLIQTYVVPLLGTLAVEHPIIVSVLLVMSIARAIFKPLMALIQAYVDVTPSTKDNASLAKFKEGTIYKTIVFIVDYIFSIKLPKV